MTFSTYFQPSSPLVAQAQNVIVSHESSAEFCWSETKWMKTLLSFSLVETISILNKT